MPLLLTARIADADVRRLTLRLGQEARVGSSEWVELSLPEDDDLAEEHFVVRCQSDATVEVLGEKPALKVADDVCQRLALSRDTDTLTRFVAGSTEFSIRWSPDFLPSARTTESLGNPPAETVIDESPRIAAVGNAMSLSPEAVAIQSQPDRADEYFDRLVSAEYFDDAIRFAAGFLSPSDAVAWAVRTGSLEGETPMPLVQMIGNWIESCGNAAESEKWRCEIRNMLAGAQPTNVAKWIGQAIVYTDGSLAPSDQQVIRPPSHLCGIAVLTAHRWAVAKQPDRSAAVGRWIQLAAETLSQSSTTEHSTTKHPEETDNAARREIN